MEDGVFAEIKPASGPNTNSDQDYNQNKTFQLNLGVVFI